MALDHFTPASSAANASLVTTCMPCSRRVVPRIATSPARPVPISTQVLPPFPPHCADF
jgi:hypothetical protein